MGDELERVARSGALEEAHRARRGRRVGGGALEQRPLEMRERRRGVLGGARWELGRSAVGERREILRRTPERGEGDAARLVGQRDVDLGTAGERLEQRPLRRRQVLEAVGEHGLAVPRVEIALEPLGGATPEHVAVPEAEAVELGAVGAVERGEIAAEIGRVEQARLQLAERRQQRVDEPREPGRPRALEPVGAQHLVDRAPRGEDALRLREDRPARFVSARDALEEVVERADRAAE